MDMMNILKLDSTMPTFKEIVAKPLTAIVPINGAAVCLVVSKIMCNATKETFDNVMLYIERLPKEAQALFAMSVMSSKSPQRMEAVKNKPFTQWCVLNGYLF